ncbi:MAG: hypothetical protein HY846_12300 [Nitrosomonadales bacterium]|nr:hypothetical protein [Nitrosomonadales bacterium]
MRQPTDRAALMTKRVFISANARLNVRGALRPRRIAGFSVLFAAAVLCAEQSRADPWQHAVTSRFTAEYETNPTLSATGQNGVRRALFEPGYTLAKADGVNEWRARLALLIARSSDTALSLNREDPTVSFSWRRQRDTGEFSLSARYDETATRTAEAGMLGPVAVDGTRASRDFSATWSQVLSERSTLAADGTYTGISYKGGTYVDYTTRSGGLRLTYDWSESMAPFLHVSYSDQTPSGGGVTSRRNGAAVGSSLRVSERLDCTVQAGKSRESGGSSNSQYAATARYAGQRNRLTLSADRQTSPSGLGGFVTANQARAEWSHELSERSTTGVNMSWRKNRSVTDETSRILDAWLQHDLDAIWVIRASFQHRTREISGLSASSNLAGLSLVYTRSNF